MIRKIFLAAVVFFCFLSTQAQSDSTNPAPTITGSVDAYFRYNFNDPKSGTTNNLTSFTNSQNSFQLGMASVRADHSWGKASATVDLGFGPRAEEFSYGDPSHSTLFAVKQAYVSYAVSDKFKLTIGKWATHIGYEVTDAYLNRNYSMDYMFSYGPFSHTGLKAEIGLGEKSGLMFGVANTTDVVAEAGSRRYALAQFSTGTADDKVKAFLNYQGSYGGSFNTSQFDLVLTGAVSDKFNIGYNGTVQTVKPDGGDSDSWWGSALYFTADPTAAFGITLRGEYFHNEKGVVGSGTLIDGTNIFDVTLSPNFRVGNLTIIPELRLDNSKLAIFEKNDGTATKSTVTGILAATYHF
ncbi:MAG: outer membrane beta-barrel protein [Ginsengibacter sp.]